VRPRSATSRWQAADEASVRIGVDEHLDVHQIAQRGVREYEDPLHDQRASRLERFGSVRRA
jgi:hypothetical protein